MGRRRPKKCGSYRSCEEQRENGVASGQKQVLETPGNKLPGTGRNEILIREEEGFQYFLIKIDLKDEDRKRLGITAATKERKVVVVKVTPGTPAESHFRKSDHITIVNGISVITVEEVKNIFIESKKMCIFVVKRISPQKLQINELQKDLGHRIEQREVAEVKRKHEEMKRENERLRRENERLEWRLWKLVGRGQEKVEVTKEKSLEKISEMESLKSEESSADEEEEIEDKKDEVAGTETEEKKETTDDQFEEECKELHKMVVNTLKENAEASEQGKVPEDIAERKETVETKENEEDTDDGETIGEENYIEMGGEPVKEKVRGFGREENESRCAREGRSSGGRGRSQQCERLSGSEKTFSGMKATEERDGFGQGNWGTQDGMKVKSDEVTDVKRKNKQKKKERQRKKLEEMRKLKKWKEFIQVGEVEKIQF